jgi:hypothetical protein
MAGYSLAYFFPGNWQKLNIKLVGLEPVIPWHFIPGKLAKAEYKISRRRTGNSLAFYSLETG